MKKITLVSSLLLSGVLLAACNSEEASKVPEQNTDEENVTVVQEETPVNNEKEDVKEDNEKTEENDEIKETTEEETVKKESEEVIVEQDADRKLYTKPANTQWTTSKGTIITKDENNTVLIQDTDSKNGQSYYKVHPDLRSFLSGVETGEVLTYQYYISGEDRVLVDATIDNDVNREKNTDTTTIKSGVFVFEGLSDSTSMVVTQGGNQYFPKISAEQGEYLDKNVQVGSSIEMSYTIDAQGNYKVQSVVAK